MSFQVIFDMAYNGCVYKKWRIRTPKRSANEELN